MPAVFGSQSRRLRGVCLSRMEATKSHKIKEPGMAGPFYNETA
jgi:hypothetical protein